MGVIKKKTAVRGTEGGVKYVCDVCSADITSTVRMRCAHDACKEYDLCVTCFADGKSSREHDPPTHPYSVIEQHSIPIYTEEWGADEEALLIEGAETYGLGSWADIADHIGGFRDKDEVRDHYVQTYVDSNKFPLPEHASPADRTLVDKWPREMFQARKKRRIEERKEAAKNAPPAPPKQKPTSSVPACHEVQGFMPGRLEFETEHFNDAEECVQHMQFDPGDGLNPRDPREMDPDMELKMTIMNIYNSRLTARVERKRIIFEHELLEYRKHQNAEKKRTQKEDKDLYNKCKPLARLMRRGDFDEFAQDLEYELNLRQAIAQLQEWRQMQIGDLKSGEKYEQEKTQRSSKAPLHSFDKFALASNRNNKSIVIPETSAAVNELVSPNLALRPHPSLSASQNTPLPSAQAPIDSKVLTNGNANVNGTLTPNTPRQKFQLAPISNLAPLKFNNESAPDLHLLSDDEREVCSALRIMPKPYIAIKDSVFREAQKHGGNLKKKTAKEICRIDATKGGKLFDFFVHNGWITKA